MGSAPAIDELVRTSADGKDDALRAVNQGAVATWEEFEFDGLPGGCGARAFEAKGSRQLRFTHAQRMGEKSSRVGANATIREKDQARFRYLSRE